MPNIIEVISVSFEEPESTDCKYCSSSVFLWRMKLRTTQPHGLILYSGHGHGKDFMAVELTDGNLRYVFDVGSGPRAIETHGLLRAPLNDNEWHDVSVLRPTVSQHVVTVDAAAATDSLPDTRSVHYDLLADDLYIGGVARSMYGQLPKQVRSRQGFQGCLASIDLNRQRWNIDEQRDDVPKEFEELIVKGCEGYLC